MPERRWSVRLAVETALDRGLIDAMLNLSATMRWHGMEFTPPSDDEPATITVDFDAIDEREARIRAQDMLDRAQEMARVTPRGSGVVWVAPVKDGEASSLRFLRRARDLIDEEDYDLAVIAAQVHLEVQVATLVRLAVEKHPSPLADAFLRAERSWALHYGFGQNLIESLFNVSMRDFPDWKAYRRHIKRRNDVAHSGASVDPESARESIRVVYDLWLWLTDAASHRA